MHGDCVLYYIDVCIRTYTARVHQKRDITLDTESFCHRAMAPLFVQGEEGVGHPPEVRFGAIPNFWLLPHWEEPGA